MISGTIEAKLFACILSVLKVKFRDDTLPCLAYCFLQASLGISRFAWPEPVLVRRKIIRIFFHICSVELPAGWISLSRSRAIWNITPSWTFFSGSLRVRDSGIRLYIVKIAWRICSWIKVNRNTNEIEKREMCFIFFMFLVKSVLLSPLYGLHYFQNTIVLHGFKSLVRWVCSFLVLNFQIFVSIVYSLKILFFKFWYSL